MKVSKKPLKDHLKIRLSFLLTTFLSTSFFLLGIYSGSAITSIAEKQKTMKLAVENNCGTYDTKTGDFSWKKGIDNVSLMEKQLPPGVVK